ncbi:MAG TPA: acetyl-CoA carboxylase biotin carboxyl carrier protein subunit [Chloroflexota bacterium]|nr:acetyl-CoA carboxylase biotin carboxyl carrier protein subunit [Chloroflexota bacterium]
MIRARRRVPLSAARLRELVGWLQQCGVEELELTAGAERLYLRRDGALAEPPAPPIAPATESLIIGAPAVGLFHRGPEEGAPPLVAEGATVHAGQVLGVVEVLRMPHPVEAPADGRVLRFLAESGQAVEYGQPLVELWPAPAVESEGAAARDT